MDAVLNAVIDLVETNLTLYSHITIGALPPNGGIAMFVGAGSPQNTFMDKDTHNVIYATLNGKHAKQKTVIEALESIHRYLTKLKGYPTGSDWQITDIATDAFPNLIGQESGEQWLYGSILKITFYRR